MIGYRLENDLLKNVHLDSRMEKLCTSEHDVLMCFSEHGRTLLMSWRLWPEPHVGEDGLLGVKPCLGGCRIAELWSWMSSTPPSLGRSYVLKCFLFLSDPGRLLLVQLGYLIKGRFPFSLRQDKSLGLEAGSWRQHPDPRAGTRNLEAGTRNLEA
ncbi:hypothetical protein F2Q68_00031390 [Brassica cretica]|uniref:Uncharacterized protein n=1 Tax=Brassica cretica TaxID=69181 RepID=A0A8S9GGY9_BRACR|nr:hypothetical protein F2Q68_00031390 [Brassica cretica]